MTNDIGKILNSRPFYDLTKVLIGDGHLLSIKQVGKAFLYTSS